MTTRRGHRGVTNGMKYMRYIARKERRACTLDKRSSRFVST